MVIEDIIKEIRKGCIFSDGYAYYKLTSKKYLYVWDEPYYQADTGKIIRDSWKDIYDIPFDFIEEIFLGKWYIVSKEQFEKHRKDKLEQAKKIKISYETRR